MHIASVTADARFLLSEGSSDNAGLSGSTIGSSSTFFSVCCKARGRLGVGTPTSVVKC